MDQALASSRSFSNRASMAGASSIAALCATSYSLSCPSSSSSSSSSSSPSSSAIACSSAGSLHGRAFLRNSCLAQHRFRIRRRSVCAAVEGETSMDVGRRQACLELATMLIASKLGLAVWRPEDARAREVEVGSYLPASPDDPRFVQFRATAKDTPALRAGNVQPYEFALPPTWKQERVANILSGNYCQPKCAEPWVEVKFADARQGAIQVVAAPMVRLTNKTNATIEEIGSPETILAALGPFVTGNSFDPEEVMGTSVLHRGDQTYYSYELETPFAKTGAHNLATATAKGSVVMLFVVSANDAQWSSSEPLLRSIVDSFEV